MDRLAINGGPRAACADISEATAWPVIGEAALEAIARTLQRPNYGCYDATYRFEQEFTQYLDCRYALAHCNGTSAIFAALFALELKPGDEVIVPSYTFLASCTPIVAAGAVPIFAEIEPASLNLDPNDLERRITGRTKAIMVVHLWGVPCEMDRIVQIARHHDLKIIEDAAHALGATYDGKKIGTIGDIGCFSFQASKLLAGIEGGMLVTEDRIYYERATALGHYERLRDLPGDSCFRRYASSGMGFKFRMHPATSAMLRVGLRDLEQVNGQRNRNMAYLDEQLAAVDCVKTIRVPPIAGRVYHGYRLRYQPQVVGNTDVSAFVAALAAEGIHVAGGPGYSLQHLEPFYSNSCGEQHAQPRLPVTERICRDLIGLPTFPRGDRRLLDQYVDAFRKVAAQWQDIPATTCNGSRDDASRRMIR